MRKPIALAVLALVTSASCARDTIDYFQMAPRLEYQGFSFDRPPNAMWYIRREEETPAAVLLRRNFEKPSATHSFWARVALERLAAQPASHEEFAKLADPPVQKADYSVREQSRRVELTTWQSQWCIRFETVDLVHGAPVDPNADLVLTLRGYRCLHPAFPKVMLSFYYSERGQQSELDPALSDEGEAFLRGVRIDVAPHTPAS